MPATISCVTLPVDDLKKSMAFYAALGLTPEESDDTQASYDLDGAYLVLLDRSEFGVYVESVGHRAAGRGQSEAILSYFTESRGEVDDLLNKAQSAGAAEVTEAEDDEGSYSGYFTDPDGHVWEVLHDAG